MSKSSYIFNISKQNIAFITFLNLIFSRQQQCWFHFPVEINIYLVYSPNNFLKK